MTQESNNYVLQRMAVYLDNNQMMKLKNVLDELAYASDDTELVKDSSVLLAEFLATKRLEGRSERTLMFYRVSAEKLIAAVGKNVCSITTEDIREYLSNYQIERGVCKASIDNTRRNLSSFFKWLEDENYIFKSPLRRIHKIKMTHSVKDTYADEELEKLRDDCSELRNLAIIDILNSTGMRVGELVNLDREDVNFNERECLVLGKGDKERVVYFDARSKLHLKKYLKSRTDNNPALFVSLRKPHNRLLTRGVYIMYAIDVIVHISKYQAEIKEKALVAYDKGTGKIYAFGQDAEKYENVEGTIVATPFILGKITDYNIAVAFFKYLLNKTYTEIGVKPILKKSMGICTGMKLSEIDCKAWEDCLRQSVKPKDLMIYEKNYQKTLEQIPLFPDTPVPEVIFEIEPVALNELIKGTIDEIYNIARERDIPMEDVTQGINDYMKIVEF